MVKCLYLRSYPTNEPYAWCKTCMTDVDVAVSLSLQAAQPGAYSVQSPSSLITTNKRVVTTTAWTLLGSDKALRSNNVLWIQPYNSLLKFQYTELRYSVMEYLSCKPIKSTQK